MQYTVSALAPNSKILRGMYDSLQIKCKSNDVISIIPRGAGASLPMLSITTTDLELAECYHNELEQAGALLVSSNEESSTHDAITDDDRLIGIQNDEPSAEARAMQHQGDQLNNQEIWVLQSGEDWHVEHVTDGIVLIFTNRDEAIAYTASLFFDGPSQSRAETQRGDLAFQQINEIEHKSISMGKKGGASQP
jgi:hypothetical protein